MTRMHLEVGRGSCPGRPLLCSPAELARCLTILLRVHRNLAHAPFAASYLVVFRIPKGQMETRHAGQKTMTGTKRAREGYGCAQFVGFDMKWTSDQRVQPMDVSMLRLTYLSLSSCSH